MGKITKMQQRRGLRRDLPIPLAPGEIALTTDTREVFIGSEIGDSLSGIQNKSVQLGNFATGFNFTNSHLQNNITEFTVKRDIISNATGTVHDILSLHSTLSALGGAGMEIEAGINDQTLDVHLYSPHDSIHGELTPGDPDGTPPTINDYTLIGGVGTLQIELTNPLVSTDVLYVVHLSRKDLEKYLITVFNASYDIPNGSGNPLAPLTLKLSTDQLYFDKSTGEGFISFSHAQITQNHPLSGDSLSATNKPIKDWFDAWISSATNPLNNAINTLTSDYYSGDSITGEYGIAKFGDDSTSTVPTYVIDENFTFVARSHHGAKNLSRCLNQAWLSEGSDPTRQLSHIRSNVRIITDESVGDVFANLTIGNPILRTLGNATTNPPKGTQVLRAVGSSSTTTQALLGVVKFNLTSMVNLSLDYTLTFADATPTYHVVRVGHASIGFPKVNDVNTFGHGLILDQWNEVDIMDSAGAITVFSVAQPFEFGIVVARRVTVFGDPVIEDDWNNLTNANFMTKYGTTSNVMDSQVFWIDNDSSSPTYEKYFGFLMYKNSRPVDANIEFIQKRF